jgi:hypothetical protein
VEPFSEAARAPPGGGDRGTAPVASESPRAIVTLSIKSRGTVSNMLFILTGWIVISVTALMQGIHIIYTGQPELFFLKTTRTGPPLRSIGRAFYALFYLLPSVCMMLVLASRIRAMDIVRLKAEFINNLGLISMIVLLVINGALCALYPVMMMRWMLRRKPDPAGNQGELITLRLTGLITVLIGLWCLSKLFVLSKP